METFLLICAICCALNVVIVLWDFYLEYKQSGCVERHVWEFAAYIFLIAVSGIGTIMLIAMILFEGSDNPLHYLNDKFSGVWNKQICIWRKRCD